MTTYRLKLKAQHNSAAIETSHCVTLARDSKNRFDFIPMLQYRVRLKHAKTLYTVTLLDTVAYVEKDNYLKCYNKYI